MLVEAPSGINPSTFKGERHPVLPVTENPAANEAPQSGGRLKKALQVLHRKILAPIFGR